jgi:dihydroxyacetone kinase
MGLTQHRNDRSWSGALPRKSTHASWETSILIVYSQVPGTIVSGAHLSSSEIEIGMGIHNESGVQRVSPVPPLNELIQTLLDLLLSQSDPERGFLPIQGSGNNNVALLVNNLGGVSELELGGIAREAITALSARGVLVLRVLSGTFMVTSSFLTQLALILMWHRRA